jgi:hypothetical protein
MANTVFFLIGIPLPALVAWLSIWFLADAVITTLLVGLTFAGLIFVYDKWVGDFSFERKIPEEIMNKDEKISLGIKMLIGGAIGTAALLVLWSMFAPTWMGPTSITMPFPAHVAAVIKWSYFVLFAALFLIEAALEHVYFNFFSSIEFTEKEGMASLAGEQRSFSSNLTISVGVFLLNFAIGYYVFSPRLIPALIYGFIALGVNLFMMNIRYDKKMIVSTLLRVGIAIGVLLYILYLYYTLEGKISRKTPEYYFAANTNNCIDEWLA